MHSRNRINALAAAAAAALLTTTSIASADDWRRGADDATKIENLVRALPNTADLMLLVGERYNHLYWAGRTGNWAFAEYQAKELRGLINKNRITRPGRSDGLEAFLAQVYPAIEEAAKAGDWERFEGAFADMRSACVACHVSSDFAFITLPAVPPRSNSPVLHQE